MSELGSPVHFFLDLARMSFVHRLRYTIFFSQYRFTYGNNPRTDGKSTVDKVINKVDYHGEAPYPSTSKAQEEIRAISEKGYAIRVTRDPLRHSLDLTVT